MSELLAFDLADRLAKSLRVAKVGKAEMAVYLGVTRNTVGNYVNGRTIPDLRTLRLWAMRCGVPLVWLQTGETPPPSDGGVPVGEERFERSTFRVETRHLAAVA